MNSSYHAAREGVGLFDFSRRGIFSVSGEGAVEFLDRLVTGNMKRIRAGGMASTLFLREDGSILAIVWVLRDENEFIILSHEDRKADLLGWLDGHAEGTGIKVEDRGPAMAYMALIGPRAQDLARFIAGDDIVGLPYLGFEHNEVCDSLVCRNGYTGEFEYGFLFAADRKDSFERMVMDKGKGHALIKCDVDVLDILMLEMKSINEKYDLREDSSPIEAGFHWAIDFRKKRFIGKERVDREKEGVARKLILLAFEDGTVVPTGAKAFIGSEEVGKVVNRNFSPTVGKDIGLAYIDEKVAWVGIEYEVETEDGGRRKAKAVSAPLFLTRTVKDFS
jgi:aminomethyltransferase